MLYNLSVVRKYLEKGVSKMTKKAKKTKKASKQEITLSGQIGRIFEYLKENKSATGLELWRKCGAMSWAKKISVLNGILPAMGYKIVKQRVQVYSKFAQRKVYVMLYTLQKISSK